MWLVGKDLIPKAVVGNRIHYCHLGKLAVEIANSAGEIETVSDFPFSYLLQCRTHRPRSGARSSR
jgi:hypothetical protein